MTFISTGDFVKKIQQESRDWRQVLKPGIKFDITPTKNTKLSGTIDGKRTYTAKDATQVYTATFVGYGPSGTLGKTNPEVAVLEYNLPQYEEDPETGEEIKVVKPYRVTVNWNSGMYYVNPESLQTGGRRPRGTRRGRTTRGKTRRGRKH
jgi:hypothetical protein